MTDNENTTTDFDVWWRQVLILWGDSGRKTSIKATILEELHRAGNSPHQAFESLIKAERPSSE